MAVEVTGPKVALSRTTVYGAKPANAAPMLYAEAMVLYLTLVFVFSVTHTGRIAISIGEKNPRITLARREIPTKLKLKITNNG